MPADLPFWGLCPHEVLSDAVLSFDIEFTWSNWQPQGTNSRLVYTTPLLRPGYWNFFYTQTSPTSFTLNRPGLNASWISGNYKINGSGISNSLVEIVTPNELTSQVNAGFQTGPYQNIVGSFLLGPGNVLIELVEPCSCSAEDAGAAYIDFVIENDINELTLADWIARNVPQYSTVKIHGERQ